MTTLSRAVITPIVATLFFACGGDSSTGAPTQSFVGTVSDTDAVVGLVIDGDSAFLFVCGGPKTLTSLTHWVHGTVTDGASFHITDGTFTATGTVTGAHVSGTLQLSSGQSPESWTADAPAAGTVAGVYATEITGQGLADLVVLQTSPSAAPSGQGAFRTLSNAVFQVTPLHPITRTGGGIAVNIPFQGTVEEEFLTPATAD